MRGRPEQFWQHQSDHLGNFRRLLRGLHGRLLRRKVVQDLEEVGIELDRRAKR